MHQRHFDAPYNYQFSSTPPRHCLVNPSHKGAYFQHVHYYFRSDGPLLTSPSLGVTLTSWWSWSRRARMRIIKMRWAEVLWLESGKIIFVLEMRNKEKKKEGRKKERQTFKKQKRNEPRRGTTHGTGGGWFFLLSVVRGRGRRGGEIGRRYSVVLRRFEIAKD